MPTTATTADTFDSRVTWASWPELVVALDRKAASYHEMGKMVTRKAEATQSLAKSLEKLRQRVPRAVEESEESTVSELWGALLRAEEESVRASTVLVGQLQEKVHDALSDATGALEAMRKRIVAEGQPIVKLNTETAKALRKAKERFHRLSRDHECAEAALKDAENDPKKRPKVPDYEKKLARAKEEMDDAMTAYKEAIVAANNARENHRKQMPKVMAEYQSALRARTDRLGSIFRGYVASLRQWSTANAELVAPIEAAINSLSSDSDLEEFAQKVEAPQPPESVFEPYVRGSAAEQKKRGWFPHRRPTSTSASGLLGASSPSPSPSLSPSSSGRAHFCVPLETLLERQQRDDGNGASPEIPRVVEHLVSQTLALGGAHAKGIFRLAGDSSELKQFRETADTTGELRALTDANNSAGLLKLWLRSLPEPIIPDTLYAQATADNGAALATFEQVPEPNKTLLGYLIGFLQYLAKPENSDITKMDSTNLAAMFAPCFLRCPYEDLSQTLISAEKEKQFVVDLIEKLNTSKFPRFTIPSNPARHIDVEQAPPPIGAPPSLASSCLPSSAPPPLPPKSAPNGTPQSQPPRAGPVTSASPSCAVATATFSPVGQRVVGATGPGSPMLPRAGSSPMFNPRRPAPNPLRSTPPTPLKP